MSDRRKLPLAGTAALKSFALGVGVWFALGGSLPAQAEPPDCSTEATVGWTISNPSSLEDQRKIADLLSLYAWTIDDWDAKSFAALFNKDDSTAYYELCNTGGKKQVFKLSLQDIESQMTQIVNELQAQGLKTRHLVTNTLFAVDPKTSAVTTKSTVLVTVQSANLTAPDLDYSADVRATYVNKDGNWKFTTLTVYADNAAPVQKKR